METRPPIRIELNPSDEANLPFCTETKRQDTTARLHLLIEWIAYFINQQFPLTSSGDGTGSKANPGRTWTYASEVGVRVEFRELLKSQQLRVQTFGLTPESHRALLSHATTYADAGTTLSIWWYAAIGATPSMTDQSLGLHFMRGLDHARRVNGMVALGGLAIFDFASPAASEQVTVFSPVNAKLFFVAPGVHPGPLSTKIAVALLPNLTACASYCLGTPLDIFPMSLRRADPTQLAHIDQMAMASPIRQLALDGASIGGLLENLVQTGAVQAANRVVRAIGSYETAMRQNTHSATVIHLVSAIEALARPNLSSAWKQRTVKRFMSFLNECVPGVLDATLKHDNFAIAFPGVHTVKQLTNHIYDSRSEAVHAGHMGEFYDHSDVEMGVRVALISNIVRAAIAKFIERPFSSLVGHPTCDPAFQLTLDPSSFAAMKKRADRASVNVSQYVLSLIRDDLAR